MYNTTLFKTLNQNFFSPAAQFPKFWQDHKNKHLTNGEEIKPLMPWEVSNLSSGIFASASAMNAPIPAPSGVSTKIDAERVTDRVNKDRIQIKVRKASDARKSKSSEKDKGDE